MRKILLALSLLIMTYSLSAQVFLIPYRAGIKWGYCDTLGRVKIAPIYNSVPFFSYDPHNKFPPFAIVRKLEEVMVIDTLGKLIVPPGYKEITPEASGNKCFFIVTDFQNKKGIYDFRKLLINPSFEEVTILGNSNFRIKSNGRYGLVKNDGEVLIPIQYDNITYSMLYSDTASVVWLARKGREKTKFKEKRTETNFSLDNCYDSEEALEIQRQKAEEEKRKKVVIAPTVVPKVIEVTEPKKVVVDTLELLRQKLKKQYDLDSISYLRTMPSPFFYVEKGKQKGIVDDSLKLFLLTKNYAIERILINNTESWLYKENQSLVLFMYWENGKYGITNEFDDVILPPIYEHIYALDADKFTLVKDKKIGIFLINSPYKPVLPKYQSFEFSSYFKVSDTRKFTLFTALDEKNRRGFIGENGIEYFKN